VGVVWRAGTGAHFVGLGRWFAKRRLEVRYQGAGYSKWRQRAAIIHVKIEEESVAHQFSSIWERKGVHRCRVKQRC
jgi:hypothetical protein